MEHKDYKVFEDAVGYVRDHMDRFIGSPSRLAEQLSSLLVFDAAVAGAKPIVVDGFENWWIVGSPVDWIADAADTVEQLFRRIVPTPHVGRNTNRHEILVTAYSAGLAVYRNGRREWQHGDDTGLKEVDAHIAKEMAGWRVIAFYCK